jgi:hypothetical protein
VALIVVATVNLVVIGVAAARSLGVTAREVSQQWS